MKAPYAMTVWRSEADCPKCGGKGTLLVSGNTAEVEIDGCWVCGYGRREEKEHETVFVPLDPRDIPPPP